MAFRAYRRANDFVAAAAELDDLLECNQEIVTFATLANPSTPQSSRALRTPLFPVLWRRAIAPFGGLDVRREFKFKGGRASQPLVDFCRRGRICDGAGDLGISPRADTRN